MTQNPSPSFTNVNTVSETVTGALTATNVAVTNTLTTNNLVATGAESVSGNLTVGGAIAATGNVSTSGNLTVAGTLTAGGNPIFGGAAPRNLIVNAQMRFNQRTEGSPPGLSTNGFIADQWAFNCSNNTVLTARKNIFGTPIAPPGAANSLGGQTTVVTPAAGDFFTIVQAIEGQSFAPSLWGTLQALPYVLSFWVIASTTGTFGGAIYNSAKTWTYPFTYTVTVANTWQLKTVAVPGQTSGVWATDTTAGVIVAWSYGAGATFTRPANTWVNANAQGGANGQVGNASTVAALSISGVQFEQGVSATPFEYLRVDEDLRRCLRFCEKSYSQGVAPGTVTNIGAMQASATPGLPSSIYVTNLGAQFKSVKRLATPAMTFYSTATGASGKLLDVLSGVDITPGAVVAGDASFYVGATCNVAHTGYSFLGHWLADAGL